MKSTIVSAWLPIAVCLPFSELDSKPKSTGVIWTEKSSDTPELKVDQKRIHELFNHSETSVIFFIDPYHCTAGNAVMQTINCATYDSGYRPETEYFYTATNGLLADPLAQFSCEGILKGFEYYVKGSGSITFKVIPQNPIKIKIFSSSDSLHDFLFFIRNFKEFSVSVQDYRLDRLVADFLLRVLAF